MNSFSRENRDLYHIDNYFPAILGFVSFLMFLLDFELEGSVLFWILLLVDGHTTKLYTSRRTGS